MTLKELLLKYEFDTVVPDLLTVDEPIMDNLYAFKEAFDTLRRMAPGDAQGEQIVVSLEVETEEDGTEIECYLHASNCEGDLWESSLAKEVVIEADITEIRALAQILWHIRLLCWGIISSATMPASSPRRIPPTGNSVAPCRWTIGIYITPEKRIATGQSGCGTPGRTAR